MIDQLSVLRLSRWWKSLSWLYLSVFFPPRFAVSPHSTREFTKQDILTSNRLYLLRLFAYFRNPRRQVLFILRPLHWKTKNNKMSCSSHVSDTAVAGSEFRCPKSNPSCLTPSWSRLLGQHVSVCAAVWPSCVRCLPKMTVPSHSQWRGAQSLSTERKWTGSDIVKVHESELGLLGSVRSTSFWCCYSLQQMARYLERVGGGSGCGRSPLRGTVEPERMSGCWRLESDWGTFVKWNDLDDSVPLPVGWRRQDGARFQGELRHIFGVFSYSRPYVSVLLIEELGVGGASLGAIRDRLVRRFGRQAVLPVFWIVKGHLQLLPTDFTWCQSSVLQQAGRVHGGMALVGWQAAMPDGGRSGQGSWLAHLGLGSSSCLALAGGAATWIARLSCSFDGMVGVEDVGWWAMVARQARWRGLGRREGVVGQAGLDGKWEVGAWSCGWDGGRRLGG